MNLIQMPEEESKIVSMAQHVIANNMLVALQFAAGSTEAALRDPRPRLRLAKAEMAPGLLPRIAITYYGDEMFLRLRNGGFDTSAYPTLNGLKDDRIAQANKLREFLDEALAIVKSEFPNAYTMLVDNIWNPISAHGWQYYAPAPFNVEVLGMDPYFGHGTTRMRDCDATTKAAWDGTTGFAVNWAIAYHTKPILLVGPTFRHNDVDWPQIPAPCQLEWWYQLALSNPSRIPAMLWFSWSTYNNIVVGLRSHPAELQKMIEIFERNRANKL